MQEARLGLRQLAAQLGKRGLRQRQARVGLLRIGAPALAGIGQQRHLPERLLVAFLVFRGKSDQFAQPDDLQIGFCHAQSGILCGLRQLIARAQRECLKAANLARGGAAVE